MTARMASTVDESLFGSPIRSRQQMRGTAAAAKELSQTSVVSSAYLDQIRGKIVDRPSSQDHQRALKKAELQELSRIRVKQWPNTLEAARTMKERKLQAKQEAEEAKRVELDKMEAALQEAKRKEVLERAEKLLHDRNDRVKTFHSALLLSEVIKERELQMDLKKQIDEHQSLREQERHLRDLENLREAELAQKRKEEAAKEKARKLADVQLEQLAQAKQRYADQIEEARQEGELIRRKAADDIEHERAAEQMRRERAHEAVMASKKANEYLQDLRAKQKLEAVDEAIALAKYAEMKDQVEQMKKEKLQEKFDAKLAVRQKMIDDQFSRLQDMEADRKNRLDRDVKQMEEKAKANEEEKEAKRKARDLAVQRSRQHQVDMKAAAAERKRLQEEDFKMQWRLQNEMLAAEDKQERVDLKARNKEVAQFIKTQAYEAKKKAEEAGKGDLLALEAKRKKEEEEEEKFQEYARKVMNEFAAEGKPIQPIAMAVRRGR